MSIPSGTKFRGVSPSVDTTNRGSSITNEMRDAYTIEEIIAAAASTPTPEIHLLDIESLFGAIMADPFAAADWKATFTTTFSSLGITINGQFDTNGDFSTEVSNWKAIGIVDDPENISPSSTLASANFTPTDGTILGGIEISNSFISYNFDNMQWTYKYEEDPTATGSDPKYLHDFIFTIDSTQVLGYVVIGADDSVIANNFIINSAS